MGTARSTHLKRSAKQRKALFLANSHGLSPGPNPRIKRGPRDQNESRRTSGVNLAVSPWDTARASLGRRRRGQRWRTNRKPKPPLFLASLAGVPFAAQPGSKSPPTFSRGAVQSDRGGCVPGGSSAGSTSPLLTSVTIDFGPMPRIRRASISPIFALPVSANNWRNLERILASCRCI
jgi:hypothetical protein